MGDILSFRTKKSSGNAQQGKDKSVSRKPQSKQKPADSKSPRAQRRIAAEASSPAKKVNPTTQARPKKKKETLNAESIKLWWISQEFDELIRKAVIDKHIPVEELSAVMAHRLGSLLVVSERTPELTLFCLKLISKITNQKQSDSNAS